MNIWQPMQQSKSATLAYATEMSTSGLLSATNSQRAANGKAALSINSKLNSAAQAKANDMVARDYWSHNTPDGQAPWVFFDAAGYVYLKAGENLAYGFSTSNATIVGWMNSPSHKANLLDSNYTEVGFGFANSPNFVGTGNETIVVAHYGQPYSATPPPAPAPVAPAPAPQTQNAQTAKPAPTGTPVEEAAPAAESEPEETFQPIDKNLVNQPVTSDTVVPTDGEQQRITKAQELTGGRAPWIALAISLSAIGLAMIWLFKHFIIVRRFVIEGEHFVAHHPILDVVVVGVIALAIYMSQSTGVVL